jgi:hypothetical protein
MQKTVSAIKDRSAAHSRGAVEYRERLSPSLKTLAAAAVVAPMIALVVVRIDPAASLGIGVAVGLAFIALLVFSSPVVEVRDGMLVAGRARIEVEHLGEPVALVGDDAKVARSTGLDPRGWYLIRGGIDGVLRVQNTDADDPASSWTVSTRTPDRLAAAVRRAQTGRGRTA